MLGATRIRVSGLKKLGNGLRAVSPPPSVLGMERGKLALSDDVWGSPASSGLAGLREPRRSGCLCAMDGKGLADGGRMAPGSFGHNRGTRAAVPVGIATSGPCVRQLR